MVGNDVVDLSDTDALPGTRHRRFDERVFSPRERQQLTRSEDPRLLRWALWAAKESAYKAARRRDPGTIFAPPRFVVELDADLVGHVRHGDDVFPVTVTVEGECVHAVATDLTTDPTDVISGVELANVDGDVCAAVPGLAARALATAHVARKLGVRPDSLTFERQGRAPDLKHRDGRTAGCLSLSHHGRFVAYAWSSVPGHAGELD